jgi:hypothetical protein
MSKRPKKQEAASVARTPWQRHFFQRHRQDDPTKAVPAQDFLLACPEKVRAMMLAVVNAVAAAPPPQFSGAASGRPCTARWQATTRSASTDPSATTIDSSAYSNAMALRSASTLRASCSSAAGKNRSEPSSPRGTTRKSVASAANILHAAPEAFFADRHAAARARRAERPPPGARTSSTR